MADLLTKISFEFFLCMKHIVASVLSVHNVSRMTGMIYFRSKSTRLIIEHCKLISRRIHLISLSRPLLNTCSTVRNHTKYTTYISSFNLPGARMKRTSRKRSESLVKAIRKFELSNGFNEIKPVTKLQIDAQPRTYFPVLI